MKNWMKIFICALNFILIGFSQANANECKQEAKDFTQQIQTILKNKDLEALYKLVDGELESGPRRSAIIGKKFDDVFGGEWADNIAALAAEPDACEQMGWRGYMMGSGWIWFDEFEKGWKISAINMGTSEPRNKNLPVSWVVNNTTLPFECFSYEWSSSDNFKEFANQYHIENYQNFAENPGKYANLETAKSIKPSWCSKEDCKQIALVNYVEECSRNARKAEIKNEITKFKIEDEYGGNDYEYYEILGSLENGNCQKLAPDMPGTCTQSFLIRIGDTQGTMNYSAIGLYGLFEMADKKQVIVPLKFFATNNDSLNFLENLP